MRATLWLVALFGVAVAVALFAGNNHNTVTLFWEPYRIDASFNLVLAALVLPQIIATYGAGHVESNCNLAMKYSRELLTLDDE